MLFEEDPFEAYATQEERDLLEKITKEKLTQAEAQILFFVIMKVTYKAIQGYVNDEFESMDDETEMLLREAKEAYKKQ